MKPLPSTFARDSWIDCRTKHRLELVFRFSVKWRSSAPPLVSVPPLRGGDFQGIRVYRSDAFLGRARKANFRARHRLDEPAKLSLGLVASLQIPLPFHLAKSL
jgi:hypothetical protein